MPLKGIRILEFAGLAPAPLCGKILSDFGASVTRIDKTPENLAEVMHHGKNTLAINLKDKRGGEFIRRIIKKYDVLLEPFRPGVMEKFKIGPSELLKIHPELIYARLTGFGQNGPLSQRAGHDINFAAISGVLSMLAWKSGKPIPPLNILADFAGGSLICALGICLALLERQKSGKGQIIDSSMTEGAAYLSSWLFMSRPLPIWSKEQGQNTLDGGSFYDVYKTKDNKYMSVGPLEEKFFVIFKHHLNLPHLEYNLLRSSDCDQIKSSIQRVFLTKTQSEWTEIFENIDACVYPIVDWQNVMNYKHNKQRDSFELIDNIVVPKPAPRLSRTPGYIKSTGKCLQYDDILNDFELSKSELNELVNDGTIILPSGKSNL